MNTNKIIEILQNIHTEDEPYVGKSISILARFAQEKLPVSLGFVVTTLGFNTFLDFSDLKKYYENSKKSENGHYKDLENAFDVVDVPSILSVELSKAYAKISGFSDAYVNMRALILQKNGQEISHRSFVVFDIRGEANILSSLKELYKTILFDNEDVVEKFFNGDLQIVMLVQKSQQSEASGIMFTTDIITQDSNKLAIEAVYGLESIVDFDPVIPDQYIYDKAKGEITEKHVTTQEYMAVRQVGHGNTKIQKVKISPAWQKRQKLDDKHILTLARTGVIIEEGMNEPQQVIWLFEAGKIWINFIESSQKIKLNINKDHSETLQQMIDEKVLNPSISDTNDDGTDVKFHIPDDVRVNKNVLVDLVLSNKEEDKTEEEHKSQNVEPEIISTSRDDVISSAESTSLNEQTIMSKNQDNQASTQVSKEPLLEGKAYAGDKAQGEVCFNPSICKSSDILVLKGDEDLPSDIKVSGFVIEDESDILAIRLHEYFAVPVITGVPLARKILKQGELIEMNGANGHVYETVPYSEQVGEIEMNFVTRNDNKIVDDTTVKIPVSDTESFTVHAQLPELEASPVVETENNADIHIDLPQIEDSSDAETITISSKKEKKDSPKKEVESEINLENDVTLEPLKDLEDTKAEEISRLLNLVQEDTDIVDLQEHTSEPVEGVSTDDQFNVWGKSLEKMITASKRVPTTTALEAIEQAIDDVVTINQSSKELSFDSDEVYISQAVHIDDTKEMDCPFVPTATKVYVSLIDEKLPTNFKNFDGLLFTSSYDQDIYLELLESVLESSDDKEVLAICPPYEKEALTKFLEAVHDLRNKRYRNLSLILPDYRNKKEIADTKRILSSIGLRRSSTFHVLANVSRAINVFRMAELEKSTVDGVYIDLFRLKMNMLGVERLTASTNYADGMKNMVNYINEMYSSQGKSILNITGFRNIQTILQQVLNMGFWAIGASLADANDIKNQISSIEKKKIIGLLSTEKKNTKKTRRK